MMHRYARGFSILFVLVTLSVSSASATASGADDAKAGRAALQRGEYDEAIRLSTRALESSELSPENRAIVFSSRGIAWYLKKDYDRAIADYTEALRLNPQDAGVFNNRGSAWKYKGDLDRAITDYSEAIRLNPHDAQAMYNRGVAWKYKGDLDRAIADYSEALRLNSQPQVFNDRGVAWSDKKDYNRAIADYSEAIRLNPKLATVFYNRGDAWFHKKDYDRAIDDFSEAIRLKPRYVYALHNRGLAQFYQARFGPAATDLAQWQNLQPDDAYAAIWLYLARARGGAKDATSELSANAKRLKADPWPAPLVALFTGKSDPKTVRNQAANADPEVQNNQMCEANFYLGQWQLLMHQNEEARALFRQAQDECPKSFVEYDGAVAELKRM